MTWFLVTSTRFNLFYLNYSEFFASLTKFGLQIGEESSKKIINETTLLLLKNVSKWKNFEAMKYSFKDILIKSNFLRVKVVLIIFFL